MAVTPRASRHPSSDFFARLVTGPGIDLAQRTHPAHPSHTGAPFARFNRTPGGASACFPPKTQPIALHQTP
jgi:hypothetical protein